MAIEKFWLSIPVQLFSANGTSGGLIQVPDSTDFKVKQKVILYTNSIPFTTFEVKRVNSDTELEVGRMDYPITDRADLTAYTVASGAAIFSNLQPRNTINNVDSTRAVYEEEPTVALRNVLVNKIGDKIDSVEGADGKTRLAVDAEVNVEVNQVTLFTKPWDKISATYPLSTQEIYTSSLGGIPQQQATVDYTDATKDVLVQVQRVDL